MRSIQLIALKTLEERELPMAPDPGPGEVLVRIRAVGICGSDLHWYKEGGIGPHRSTYPQVLGHEPAGEVVAAGAGVEHLKAGDRVALEPSITCGHCEFCLKGQHNNCLRSIFMGSPEYHGLFREYATIPAHNAVLIPAEMSFDEATIIEPLAVMLHILELVRIGVGDTVAVLGAGPIGMLCASIARVCGASKIFIADRVAHRLELARRMGADVAVSPRRLVQAVLDDTKGRGVDIVLDAAGAAESINLGFAAARVGATMALIGLPSEPRLGIDMIHAMGKELKIQSIKRSNHNAHAAIDLLSSGRIADAMVTHRLPLSGTPHAFEILSDYSDNVGKVIIEIE